jgi:hypothetical protein
MHLATLINNKKNKKAAIPEYIWYLSLIVIAILLVTTVITIANKTKNSNVNMPDIKDAQLLIYKTPTGDVEIDDLRILGIKKEDLKGFYLYCNGHSEKLDNIFNITTDFSRLPNNYIGLNKQNYVLNLTKYGYNKSCGDEGAQWSLFYGDPQNDGILVTKTKVKFKSIW